MDDQALTSDGRTGRGPWWAQFQSEDYLLCPTCGRAVLFPNWFEEERGACPHCDSECFREQWEGEGDEAHQTCVLPGGRFFEEPESDLLLMLEALSPEKGDTTSWEGEAWFGASPEDKRRARDLAFLVFFSTLAEVLMERMLKRHLLRIGADDALATRLLRPQSGWDRKSQFIEIVTGRKLSHWLSELESKKDENFHDLLAFVKRAADHRNTLVHAGRAGKISMTFVGELASNVPALLRFSLELHNLLVDGAGAA